jgi:predicted enzyme related to lactoylglutathione lyase
VSTAATPGRITRFYFMLQVDDMDRAIGFYVGALGTELRHRSPELSELHVGDVTICLKAGAPAGRRATGLMLEVDDLAVARAAIVAAGGEVRSSPGGPGAALEAADTEGNLLTIVPVDVAAPSP